QAKHTRKPVHLVIGQEVLDTPLHGRHRPQSKEFGGNSGQGATACPGNGQTDMAQQKSVSFGEIIYSLSCLLHPMSRSIIVVHMSHLSFKFVSIKNQRGMPSSFQRREKPRFSIKNFSCDEPSSLSVTGAYGNADMRFVNNFSGSAPLSIL